MSDATDSSSAGAVNGSDSMSDSFNGGIGGFGAPGPNDSSGLGWGLFNDNAPISFNDVSLDPGLSANLSSVDLGIDSSLNGFAPSNSFADSFLGKLHALSQSPIGKMAIAAAHPALGIVNGILGHVGNAAAGKGAQSMGAGFLGALGGMFGGVPGSIAGSMAGNSAFNGFQGTGTSADAGFGSTGLGDGLLGLYGGYRSLQEANGVRNSLADMYGQNSPYAQAMRQQLNRRDAAAGRRSQYGPREVELQAKLAQLMSQNAPAMLQANSQAGMARNLMLRNGLMAYRSLGSLFPGDSGAGSVPGGYSMEGQSYNNPSAYTAPSQESFWDNAAWPGAFGG